MEITKEDVKDSFYAKSTEDVLKQLDSSEKGLDRREATIRLGKFGKNEIPEKKRTNPFLIFLKQFNSFLIYILILAGIISFWIEHMVDVFVIGAVILINASIGFFQEYRAEKAIKALKRIIVPYARVYRNGRLERIKASDVVVGDIILLEEGDRIPADARLIESKNFMCVESSLTGESLPVEKSLEILSFKTVFADRTNMVWMGTFVASGRAKAVVVYTGKKTAIGQIALDIEKIKDVKSHFREKTDFLAKQMAVIAIIGALATFVVGFFVRGLEFGEIFLFTLASLVSGIPEGLPAVLAIVLAVGARRMARRRAIIRNLPATETLGVVSTIVTDKTGTVTENTLDIERIILADGEKYDVSGEGWNPIGEFSQKKKIINPLDVKNLSKAIRISAVCNSAELVRKKDGKFDVIGDPTEAAFVVLARKAGLKRKEMEKLEKKIDDLPFNSDLRYRASLSSSNGKNEIYVIGSPLSVLDKCIYYLGKNKKEVLSQDMKRKFLLEVSSLSRRSMRVLALAYKPAISSTKNLKNEYVRDLIFAGIVGMRDPPRKGVKNSVLKAKKAGVKVILVTGDHKETALAIAKEIGIASAKDKAITGDEMEKLSDSKLDKLVGKIKVFARLTPNMKLRIASSLQRRGEVVAMTGDGVNDAPALKKADIGVSMGVIGTDVARESSEIVLADDNFASIVNAVEEGRIVFTNTRQASFFLVTTNFAEDVTIVGTLISGMSLPLLPTQLLWLNLVTDGFAGVSLAMEPPHKDVMEEKPKNSKENILNKDIVPFVLLMVGVMAVATFLLFRHYLPDGIEKARTVAFSVMTFTQLFNFLNMRSLKKSIFKIGFLSNKFAVYALLASILLFFGVIYIPFFQGVFSFVSLGFAEMILIIAVSSLVLLGGEVYKFVRK